MQQIVQVELPTGELVWVRVESSSLTASDQGPARSAQDIGLADTAAAMLQAGQIVGFSETLRGMVASVQQALKGYRPDALAVEFCLELSLHAGKVMSVLAEVGGTAHLKVTASWEAGSKALAGGDAEGGAAP